MNINHHSSHSALLIKQQETKIANYFIPSQIPSLASVGFLLVGGGYVSSNYWITL